MRGFNSGCKGTGQTVVGKGLLSYRQSSGGRFKTRRDLLHDEVPLSEAVSASLVKNDAGREDGRCCVTISDPDMDDNARLAINRASDDHVIVDRSLPVGCSVRPNMTATTAAAVTVTDHKLVPLVEEGQATSTAPSRC